MKFFLIILSNFLNKALKGELVKKKLRRLLIATDLIKGHNYTSH